MKRKTKILIGLGASILLILMLYGINKSQDSSGYPPPDTDEDTQTSTTVKTELSELKLKQEDLFEVVFDGTEYDASAYVVQKDIPELHERITKRVEELAKEIDVSDTERGNLLTNEQREIRMLEDFAVCSYEGDANFKNGDEITIKCNSDGLKKLNIIIENTYSVKVEGLTPYEEPEPEQEIVAEVKQEKTDYIGYHNDGRVAWIWPNDVDKFNTDGLPDTVELAIVFVDTQEDFDKIKSKALKGEIDIDEIQFLFNVYEKNDNFKEAKEWKGVAY